MSTSIGFCDLNKGEKRVLCTPFSCCSWTWKDNCDIDELWLIWFDLLSQTETQQGMFVLKNPQKVQIENHFSFYIFEKTCKYVFLLRSWQISLWRNLIEREIKKRGMTLPDGFIALALLEECSSEVGLNKGKHIGFPKFPLTFAINSCHAIWFDYKPS